MEKSGSLEQNSRRGNLGYMLATAFSFTLFIAFIDEGYYNFQWIYDAGSWIAVVIYTMLFFSVLYLVFGFVLKQFVTFSRVVLVLLMLTVAVGMFVLGTS